MASYSKKSKANLNSCGESIREVFNVVIKYFDNTVLYGHRSASVQFDLYKKGRKQDENGHWIIVNRKKIVTYCDGYNRLSNHNYIPSRAIDAVPFPIDFSDADRIRYFAGYVLAVARMLYDAGKIPKMLRWGGDWDSDRDLEDQIFNDLLHFEEIW